MKKQLERIGIVFSLPSIFFFFFLMTIPILFTIFISFSEWHGYQLSLIKFIGFNNYIEAFKDRVFLTSLLNTLIFVIISTIFLNLFGFIAALIIDTKIPGTKFLKNVLFLPVILSPIIIGVMWSRMLDAFGIINNFLISIHLIKLPILFLGSQKIALYSIIAAALWQYTGFDMILYYAGLQGISTEVMDAAKIDGANQYRVITKIILPLLSPIITIAVIFNVIGGFKVFDVVYVMTSGGPNHHTEVLSTYLFTQAFRLNQMGYASFIAMVIIVFSLIISIIRLRATRDGF